MQAHLWLWALVRDACPKAAKIDRFVLRILVHNGGCHLLLTLVDLRQRFLSMQAVLCNAQACLQFLASQNPGLPGAVPLRLRLPSPSPIQRGDGENHDRCRPLLYFTEWLWDVRDSALKMTKNSRRRKLKLQTDTMMNSLKRIWFSKSESFKNCTRTFVAEVDGEGIP